jgi:hypothetical protein
LKGLVWGEKIKRQKLTLVRENILNNILSGKSKEESFEELAHTKRSQWD